MMSPAHSSGFSTGALNDGKWHYIKVVFPDVGNKEFWIDGTRHSSTSYNSVRMLPLFGVPAISALVIGYSTQGNSLAIAPPAAATGAMIDGILVTSDVSGETRAFVPTTAPTSGLLFDDFNVDTYLGTPDSTGYSTFDGTIQSGPSDPPFTLAMWVKGSAHVDLSNNLDFYFDVQGPRYASTYVGTQSNNIQTAITTGSLDAEAWHLVTWSYDGGTTGGEAALVQKYCSRFHISIDGQVPQPSCSNEGDGHVGSNQGIGPFSIKAKMIDQIMVFNEVLTDEELSKLFETARTAIGMPVLDSMQHHWPLIGQPLLAAPILDSKGGASLVLNDPGVSEIVASTLLQGSFSGSSIHRNQRGVVTYDPPLQRGEKYTWAHVHYPIVGVLASDEDRGVLSVTAVDAGEAYSCGLISDGSLLCWGDIDSGTDVGPEFMPLPAGRTAVHVSGSHVVLDNGSVLHMSMGNIGSDGGTSVSSLVGQVFTFPGGVKATKVEGVTDSSVCALLDNGSVACWGVGSSGQLGNG
ncbi:MAG TPA: hypothetical protein QF646_00350, partial [Candidatus Poseidoniales archaeon]|nr:hypothetical protein [Candidatus Poseidoniales archaeon]